MNASAKPDVAWRFSLSRSPYLRDPEHSVKHYARSVGEAPGITMIMIVAAVVGLSHCVVQSWRLAIHNDLDAARIDVNALINGRVETHPALRGNDVTAN